MDQSGVSGVNLGDVSGTSFVGNTLFSDARDATVAGGNAASFNTSSFNGSTDVQNYATDDQGNFVDPNPLVQRSSRDDCPPSYVQNVTIRYLQPPQLEPHMVC